MYDELIKRLHRYSENCVAYKLEADFADAVQQAADAIEELWKKYLASEVDATNLTGWLTEEHAKHLWIPVTERLPEDGQWVLVWGHGQRIPIMMVRESGAWIDDQFEFHTAVTHWMPLPQPPKEET